MAGILHRDPPPLPVIPFGAEWGDVIGRLLAKDVDQRYPDAAALVRDLASLERLTQGQPVIWPRRSGGGTVADPAVDRGPSLRDRAADRMTNPSTGASSNISVTPSWTN